MKCERRGRGHDHRGRERRGVWCAAAILRAAVDLEVVEAAGKVGLQPPLHSDQRSSSAGEHELTVLFGAVIPAGVLHSVRRQRAIRISAGHRPRWGHGKDCIGIPCGSGPRPIGGSSVVRTPSREPEVVDVRLVPHAAVQADHAPVSCNLICARHWHPDVVVGRCHACLFELVASGQAECARVARNQCARLLPGNNLGDPQLDDCVFNGRCEHTNRTTGASGGTHRHGAPAGSTTRARRGCCLCIPTDWACFAHVARTTRTWHEECLVITKARCCQRRASHELARLRGKLVVGTVCTD